MIRSLAQNIRNLFNSNRFVQLTVADTSFARRLHLTGFRKNDAENAEKLKNEQFERLKKYRQAEVHLWHASGYKCINPEFLTNDDWQYICSLDSKHQRKKYCKFMLVKMEAKAAQKELKQVRRDARAGIHEKIVAERKSNPHIVYGLGHNAQFFRIISQTINKWYRRKLHFANLYGQKLIVDCSFEENLSKLEQSRVLKGMKRLCAENREHKKPLDLHFCDVPTNSNIIDKLIDHFPDLSGVHTQNLTELFPKERLVMLTSDSPNVLDYCFDDIYIIGAIVDFGRSDPLTFAKAKKLGIRSARLPIDNLRLFEGDSRELPFSSVAAFVRECQINRDLKQVIDKCVYTYSKRKENLM